MASVLVDGLAVEIKKSSMDAASDVEALAKSFKKLYSALPDTHTTKAGKEIKSIADKIRELGKAINELDSEKLKNLATVFEGFRGFKNFDAMSASVREAAKAASEGGVATDKAGSATESAGEEAEKAAEKFDELDKKVGELSKTYNKYMKLVSWAKKGDAILDKAAGSLGVNDFSKRVKSMIKDVTTYSSTSRSFFAGLKDSGTFNGNLKFLEGFTKLATLQGQGVKSFGVAVGSMSAGFKDLASVLMSFPSNALSYLTDGFKQIGTLPTTIYKRLSESFSKFIDSLPTRAINLFKKALHSAMSVVEKFASALESVADKGKEFGKEILHYFGESLIEPIAKVKETYDKLGSSLARVAFYRAVRSAIKELTSGFKDGIENMYYWSSVTNGVFHNSLDSMATDLLYVKNSMASALAPAINALVPIVMSLANAFATAANAIARFFAMISGATSFTSAKRSVTEYKEALGGAAGSAEKLNKMLLGIDELNVFSDSSSGGGGSSVPNYADMFEEVDTGGLPDWLQAVKDSISEGDFSEAGHILASKLNSIVNDFDAKAWGKNLGSKLQKGVNFFLGFMHKANWRGMAKKASDLLTGALDEISPEEIGHVLSDKLSVAFQMFGGFITGLRSWESSTGNSVGTYLAKVIKGWFEGVNWIDAAATIREGFKLAIDNLFDFIDEMKSGGGFFQKIKDFFTVLNFREIWGTFKTRLFETLDVDSWTDIAEKICAWFTDTAIPFIINKIPEWADKFSEFWGAFETGIKTILESEEFSALKESVKTTLGGIVQDGVSEAVNTAIQWVKDNISFWDVLFGALFYYGDSKGKVAAIVGEVLTNGDLRSLLFCSGEDGAQGFADGVDSKKLDVESSASDMSNGFVDKIKALLGIHSPSTVLKDIGINAMDGFINGIKEKMSDLKSAVSGITETFSELSSGIGASVTADVSLNKNGWTSLSSYVGNASARVPVTLYKSGWTSLKSFIGATTISVPVKITLTGTTLKQQIKNSIGTITLATNQNGTQKTVGSVYALAKGGIISSPTMLGNGYLAGEAGAEAVIPLENNTGWLDGVADRIIAAINSGSTNETVSISMDGDVFYRQMVKKQRQNAARTGVASSFA